MKHQRLYLSVIIATCWYTGCASDPANEINLAPEIANLRVEGALVPSNTLSFHVDVSDPEGDSLSALWTPSHGRMLIQSTDSASWASPDSAANIRMIYTVEDAFGNLAADTLSFWIDNQPPTILYSYAEDSTVLNGNTLQLFAAATDPDEHAVELYWSSPWGHFLDATGESARWVLPDSTMHAWASVTAQDAYGAEASDTVHVKVYTEVGCAWILNQGQQEIVKLSSIGDELLRLGGFSDLVDIEVDPENRRVWLAEAWPPALHAIDLSGQLVFSETAPAFRPKKLRSWYRTGSLFVIDEDSAQVLELSLQGDQVLRRVSGLSRPNDLDINQHSGELWICDEGGGKVFHLFDGYEGDIAQADSSEHLRAHGPYPYPAAISVEDSTGACWVADREDGLIVRHQANGLDSLMVTGFENPVALATASTEGLCWVLDRGLDGSASRYFFNQRQVEYTGLLFPKDLAFNRIDDHAWVLDSERNRVLRLDPDGEVTGSWTDYDFPTRIVINGGY